MLTKIADDQEFLFAAEYKDLFTVRTPFQSVTSWSGIGDCDITDHNRVRRRCAEVEWNFLSVLGVQPILGGTFSQTDGQPGAPRKALIGFGVWQSRFASDRQVVGKTLILDGAPVRIVGVLPAAFELPTLQHADLLTPQVIDPAGFQPGATRVLRSIGRLKDGVTLESARSQLAPFFHRLLENVPDQYRKEIQFEVRSVRDRQMGDARLAAWTLLGAVLVVMLISCANVANLLLARAASRQTELAVRTALGISSARLLRQLLTESLLLAVSGGVAGCALGSLLLHIAIAANPDGIPHLADASLDGRVLAASMGLSVLGGMFFGLVPAFQRLRIETLSSSCGVTPRASTAFKNALITAQIALSMVLLAAAGLLVRSLWNLESQTLGMQTDHVLTAQLVLPSSSYRKPEERVDFFNRVERQLAGIPGARALGLSDSLPPGGWQRSRPLYAIEIAGQPKHETGTGGLVNWRYVSPGYFTVLQIPVLSGRTFQEDDRRSGANLCIFSKSLSNRLFPNHNAVGQHLKIGGGGAVEIVGVVPDVKNNGLAVAGNPEYYILRTHTPDDTYLNATGPVAQSTLSILLRSPISDEILAPLFRQEIAKLNPTLPVAIKTMQGRLGELDARPRFDALLLLAFGGVGLFLAAIGVYGTIAYLVAQRTHEIGIRMSLGATPAAIARLVLGHSVRWSLAGAFLGILLSLATTRILASLLFRVSPQDPITLLASAACLLLCALLATAYPAFRAAAVDPMIALRNDN
jgi:predicted permease